MKNKSIIMTAESVVDSLDKRKTKTRRVMEPQPSEFDTENIFGHPITLLSYQRTQISTLELSKKSGQNYRELLLCARYQPGDIVYAKEQWQVGYWDPHTGEIGICYKDSPICKTFYQPDEQVFNKFFIESTEDALARGFVSNDDGYFSWAAGQCPTRWRNPRFMYKWASRLWLEIIDVSAETLQDMGEKDAVDEGCTGGVYSSGNMETALEEYIRRWNAINAKRGYPWKSNPAVFVYEYKVIDKPEIL